MNDGETTLEIKKATGLNNGNFNYWVRYKLKIDPIAEKRKGNFITDVFPKGTIKKVLKVRPKNGKN